MKKIAKLLSVFFAVSILLSCSCRNGSCRARKRYYSRHYYGVVIEKDTMQYAIAN